MMTEFLAVAAIGGLVGTAEIMARYRDEPIKALFTWAGIVYFFLNAGASVLALALIRLFDWDFGQDPIAEAERVRWTQVGVAGFSALALFRSSLFMLRVGNDDVAVGPNSLLLIFLGWADRQVDRARARQRARRSRELMADVPFEVAAGKLTAFCFELMQNVDAEEQRAFGQELDTLAAAPIDDSTKAQIVGLRLLTIVGEAALEEALDALGLRPAKPRRARRLVRALGRLIGVGRGSGTSDSSGQ